MILRGKYAFFRKIAACGIAAVALLGLMLVFQGTVARGAALFLPRLDAAPCLEARPSPMLLDREGRLLCAFLNDEEQWLFPFSLETASPHLINATLAAEDKRFYRHAGIDLCAVLRAVWSNARAGDIVSGASTLTMQLVKQQYPGRGFSGKAAQALAAIRLERCADKDAILGAYLNRAPYGGNLVGAEAAARRYFGKSASEVTLDEVALLAGLPKSPTLMNPFLHPERALARRNAVLARMCEEGFISEDLLRVHAARPLGVSWHEFPLRAPHTAQHLRERARRDGSLVLALDGVLQARLEDLVREHLRQFDNQINNAALMVVDTRSCEILARIGSADFYNGAIQGQYDACSAPRAPGSALKPFVYALAMERQRLYPTEAFLDRDLDYGIYNPNNFDGEFNGLVSAGEALRWSLNIPAVQVLERMGVDPTLEFLRSLGFGGFSRVPEYYGLGLVLGNCEVRLEALVNAYLALARLGLAQEAVLVREDSATIQPRRVLSEGVALALWYMLEQPFPDEPWTNLVRPNDRTQRICWKTGTSSGYRDAWAVAFNGHYVVGVWLGNTDGHPSHRLIGAQAALPLAARVFRSLPVPSAPAWPPVEGRLAQVKVCAATGLPAGPWCPVTSTALFPAEQYLHRQCDVHRPGDNGTVEVHWPAETRNWDLAKVPAARESARTGAEDSAAQRDRRRKLAIKTPVQNATYVLSGEEGLDRIRLEANAARETLQWYCNGRYLGVSDYHSPLFMELTPGEQEVSCMNAGGQTAKVTFVVTAG